MNKAKVAYHNEQEAVLMAEPMEHNVELRIDGLEQIEPGVFRLRGVERRVIDWELLREALKTSDDDLMVAVERAILKYDMVQLLTERVRC